MSKKIDAALANLRAEATRLAPEQGRIARRNARRAVLGALRQVRNAMNVEFPQLRKPAKMGATEFVIEIFERGPKRVGKRLYIDRWVTFRKDRFPFSVGSAAFAQKLFDSNGYCRPMDFATAAKYVKRLHVDFDEYLWRLREVGTYDNVIMAAIL